MKNFKSKVSDMLEKSKNTLLRPENCFYSVALFGVYKITENPDVATILGYGSGALACILTGVLGKKIFKEDF